MPRRGPRVRAGGCRLAEYWTEQEDDWLRRMVAEGMTAAKIGNSMSRSVSSIVGRCHRLDVRLGEGRSSNNGITSASVTLPVAKLPFTPTEFECKRIGMADPSFTARSCKWPVNHAEDPRDHLFCGNATGEGVSYCRAHLRWNRGRGTPAERRALYVLKKMADA